MAEITEAEIRARLRAEIEVLKASRNRLADLRASIPPSWQETSEADLDGNLDLATEIRAVLQIQLQENLNPLLKRLRAAAEYRPPARQGHPRAEPLEPGRLDLSADEEIMQPVVYALVVRDQLTARPSDENPWEILVPPGTPEEVGLQVWKFHGRWVACWRKPNAPEDAPEDERWEVLLIEEDERRPGSLFYREL